VSPVTKHPTIVPPDTDITHKNTTNDTGQIVEELLPSEVLPEVIPPAIIAKPTGIIIINKYRVNVNMILFVESRHNTLHIYLLRHGRI
jgi:hypothetical protein